MENRTGVPAEKAGPKDVFLHLLSIIALYVSAGMFVNLIFNYVNIWLPDAVSDNYYTILSARSSARWAIASLIVVFPVYIWSVWFLNKNYAAVPEKREMKIRKWLLYFTLFAAGIIIMGDFVTLIYNFLQGELTVRFVLKIVAVFIVAGAVFGYYLQDLKRDTKLRMHPNATNLFAYSTIAIVLIAIVTGFFITGSPKEERARRFDDQRVQNLQMIQSEIINFWIKKAALPKSLDELADPIRGIVIPEDPEIGTDYVYEISGPETFKLCAIFNLPSLDQEISGLPKMTIPQGYINGVYVPISWEHSAGQTCFDRKIDKDLYKPEKPR